MVGWLVMPVAMLCAGLMMTPSYAVFNTTTSNTGSTFSAGSVVLQNNSSGTNATTGSALFTASALQPGATASRCVVVTSTGTASSAVSLYVSSLSATGDGTLPQYLTMTIGIGTGTAADCSNYTESNVLASANGVHLSSLPTTFGTGSTGWTPTGAGGTRMFKVTYRVDTTVPNTQQNTTATATFTWEAQSS